MVRYLSHDWWPKPVPGNVEMEPGSHLYSTWAFIHYRSVRSPGVRIGRDTGVYIGTMFDVGPEGCVEIGACGAIAGPIISTRADVSIGDYALISYGVVIADSPLAYPPGTLDGSRGAGSAHPPRDVVIGDNVWIGARAIVLGGARIGSGAVIGASAIVDFEVPDNAIAGGSPARVIGSVKDRG